MARRARDRKADAEGHREAPGGLFARRQPPIRRYLTRHSYSYDLVYTFPTCRHDLTDPCISARQPDTNTSVRRHYSANRGRMQGVFDNWELGIWNWELNGLETRKWRYAARQIAHTESVYGGGRPYSARGSR